MKLALPRNRYWGEKKPPKNRAEIFNVTTKPRAAADGGGTVGTIRIYGPIDSWGGYWGVSSEEVGQALDGFGADIAEILVRINSPGGEAWEGLAIMNMLRAHKATVRSVVDGVAASAATLVALGADEVVMSPGTQFMIHDASTFAYGNPAEIAAALQMIITCSDSIADVYAEKAGGTAKQWRALQQAETWYSAKETAASGLADKVAVVPDIGGSTTAGEPEIDPYTVEDYFDFSIYNYAGRSNAPAPAAAADLNPRPKPRTGPPTPKEVPAVTFSDEQLTDMRQKLGLAEDADEATILAALSEALEERAEPVEPAGEPAVKEGQIVVSKTAWDDMAQKAEAGSTAAIKLQEQERKQFLDSHRNRFPANNRKRWEEEYDRDPEGTRKYLSEAAPLVPDNEAGHGGEGEDTPTPKVSDDPKYKEWSF